MGDKLQSYTLVQKARCIGREGCIDCCSGWGGEAARSDQGSARGLHASALNTWGTYEVLLLVVVRNCWSLRSALNRNLQLW